MSSSGWLTDMSTTTSTTNADSKCYDCSSCCGLKYLRKKQPKNRPHCDSTSIEDSSNRNLPYSERLPHDLVLVEGKAIFVQGKVLQNCTRFAVNLVCEKPEKHPGKEADVAFHFNPRLDQRYIVRNCRVNGGWGDEETASQVPFPFECEKPFSICILVDKKEFQVAVDGKHFCNFPYRVPLINIVRIEVVGKVEITKLEYRNLDRYPELTHTPNNYATRIHGTEGKPRSSYNLRSEGENFQLPFTGYFPHGFSTGCELEIRGRVKVLPHSFYINLQKGSQVWPHPTIGLHLNPRFKTAIGEHVLIRNAWVNGSWGDEERLPGYHFQPGVNFTMVIRKEIDKYSLWLNDKLCGEFNFRTKHEEIDVVYIQGDVVIKELFLRSNKH